MTIKMPISAWANGVSPSPTLQIDAKAKALLAEGKDVCLLGTGEPDFDTPLFIKEACIKALNNGKTKYIPSAGLPALREALAHKYNTENKLALTVGPQNIVVSPGGKFSCLLAILATCSPDDEVLIPSPYWVSYPEMAKLAGASPKFIHTKSENAFKLTPELLQGAITPKTRLLILNTPSNPTGSVYSQNELLALMEVVLKAGIYVLSDEIYEHLLYDGAVHTSLASLSPEIGEITLTASGFSKTFAMTGWRLGSLVAPTPLAKAVDNLQSHMTSNATTFAQYGALEALVNKKEYQAFLQNMLASFDKRRKLLHQGLNAIPGIHCSLPPGAFYLFPNIAHFSISSHNFATQLLEAQNVSVVPGSAFGTEDHLRLSYTASENAIEKSIERLEYFCQNQIKKR